MIGPGGLAKQYVNEHCTRKSTKSTSKLLEEEVNGRVKDEMDQVIKSKYKRYSTHERLNTGTTPQERKQKLHALILSMKANLPQAWTRPSINREHRKFILLFLLFQFLLRKQQRRVLA